MRRGKVLVIRTARIGVDLPIFLKRTTTSIYGDYGGQKGCPNQTKAYPYVYAKSTAEPLLYDAQTH